MYIYGGFGILIVTRMTSVHCLLEKQFPERTLEGKSEIKRLGRPIPLLEISQCIKMETRSFNRNFNSNVDL